AMVNPSNIVAFDDVRRYIKGAIIEPRVCTEEDFRRFMESVYPRLMGLDKEKRKELERRSDNNGKKDRKAGFFDQPMQSLEDLQQEILSGLEIQNGDDDEKPTDTLQLTSEPQDAPVGRLANNILALAIKKRASDIHLEPQ